MSAQSTQVRFIYKDQEYLRVIPGKNLFRSTMVHEVVNRRDIFAVRISDSVLTIIPGNAQVQFLTDPTPRRKRTKVVEEQEQQQFVFDTHVGSGYM